MKVGALGDAGGQQVSSVRHCTPSPQENAIPPVGSEHVISVGCVCIWLNGRAGQRRSSRARRRLSRKVLKRDRLLGAESRRLARTETEAGLPQSGREFARRSVRVATLAQRTSQRPPAARLRHSRRRRRRFQPAAAQQSVLKQAEASWRRIKLASGRSGSSRSSAAAHTPSNGKSRIHIHNSSSVYIDCGVFFATNRPPRASCVCPQHGRGGSQPSAFLSHLITF